VNIRGRGTDRKQGVILTLTFLVVVVVFKVVRIAVAVALGVLFRKMLLSAFSFGIQHVH